MGTIRLLLAIAVVIYHSYPILGVRLTGGQVSVQSFYLISGFFIAMILNEKYKAGSFKLFITNRFLRLYPVYLVVLLLTVGIGIVGWYGWHNAYSSSRWVSYHEQMSVWTSVRLGFSNLTMICSDWAFFEGYDKTTGTLFFTRNPYLNNPFVMNFLLVPQIWSVGVELSFYCIAPLLVRRNWKWQLGIVAVLFVLRYLIARQYWPMYDPWSYRFFPFEIAVFLSGSLMYQVYVQIRDQVFPKWLGPSLLVFVVSLMVVYPMLMFIPELIRPWYFYPFFAFSMPFLFHWSRNLSWDRNLGELSYPLYCVHLFVIGLLYKHFIGIHNAWYGFVAVSISLILAWLLVRFVVNPIEQIRQKRVDRLKAEKTF